MLSDSQVRAIVSARLSESLSTEGNDDTALRAAREKALKYYRGDPLGNEVKGRSQLVSRDIAEAVDSLIPQLMKIFVGSDRAGTFEATKPEEEESARQATDYANWVFLQKNNGPMITHTWIKDGLLNRLGVVKVWWEPEEKRRREAYEGLTDDEFVQLDIDDDDIVSEHAERVVDFPGPMGIEQVRVHDIVLQRLYERGCVKIVNLPPEDFAVDTRATSDDTISFAAHRFCTTVSDLIEMGFDKKLVEKIPTGYDEFDTEKSERDEPERGLAGDGEGEDLDPAMRKVWVAECYLRMDFDEDGYAEWRKVTVGGPTTSIILLDNEEADDHPFCSWTPFPFPHKLHGESLADKIVDIQDAKTALIRQTMDNLYQVNQPRPVIDTNIVTVEDVLNHEIGHPIRADGNVQAAVMWQTVPFSAGHSFKALEYFDQARELRTGVSRITQGMDPDAINKTATGVNAITNFAQERVATIARVLAETGFKRMYKRILELVTKYQDKEKIIKLRGQWVPMRPTEWSDQMDFSVTVGIGTGNKDQALMHLNNILNIQMRAVQFQGGVNGPLVSLDNLYNTLARIIENAGLKSPELYFQDPGMAQQQPQPEPPPDPNMVKIQQEGEIKKAELEQKGKIEAANLQLKARATEAELQLKRETAAAELAMKRDQGMAQQAMSRDQMMADQAAQQRPEPDEGHAEIVKALESFMQRQERRDEMQDRALQEMRDKNMELMTRLMTSGRKIVRGADGRAEGVQIDMGGA